MSALRRIGVLALALLVPLSGHGYGPAGHLVAGAAAAPLVCADAARRIAELGGGEALGELGLWADRIRGDARWDRAAPWHYVNVEADQSALEHLPEGNVLWAIKHFAAELEDETLAVESRANALKFLIHFIVDLHQPLHVGLASDRGGNDVDVRFGRTTTNLHAFWDTAAIELTGLDIARYAAGIRSAVARAYARSERSTPEDWARESLALRDQVYAFDRATGRLTETYLRAAQRITRERLVLAAARLARTLNAVYCR